MSQSRLAKKLLIKPAQTVTVVNAPEGFERMLRPLPQGATVSHKLQPGLAFALLFVHGVSELARCGPKVVDAMAYDGLLWIAYPKKSSKIESDLNRDAGWDIITAAGLRCVTQIAIDETWSGSRFRPAELIGIGRASGDKRPAAISRRA
jgi:hypothetical protein